MPPWAYQPEWYRESRLFVPGTAGVFYYFGVKQNTVPADTAKGLIDRPLETSFLSQRDLILFAQIKKERN